MLLSTQMDKSKIRIIGSTGKDGKGENQFAQPRGICLDHETKEIYIVDCNNHRVQVYHLYSLAFVRQIGKGVQGNSLGSLNYAVGVCLDLSNQLFVSDTNNHRIAVYNKLTGVHLRNIGSNGNLPGQLRNPYGICVDTVTGYLYVADYDNNRVQVFDKNSGDYHQTIGAGRGSLPGQMDQPIVVCIDYENNFLLVADYSNNRIQFFNKQTGEYVKCLGNSVGSHVFDGPRGLCICQGARLLFVSDRENNRIHMYDSQTLRFIRYIGNGYGTSPGSFYRPMELCVDPNEGILAAVDGYNHRVQILDIHEIQDYKLKNVRLRRAIKNNPGVCALAAAMSVSKILISDCNGFGDCLVTFGNLPNMFDFWTEKRSRLEIDISSKQSTTTSEVRCATQSNLLNCKQAEAFVAIMEEIATTTSEDMSCINRLSLDDRHALIIPSMIALQSVLKASKVSVALSKSLVELMIDSLTFSRINAGDVSDLIIVDVLTSFLSMGDTELLIETVNRYCNRIAVVCFQSDDCVEEAESSATDPQPDGGRQLNIFWRFVLAVCRKEGILDPEQRVGTQKESALPRDRLKYLQSCRYYNDIVQCSVGSGMFSVLEKKPDRVTALKAKTFYKASKFREHSGKVRSEKGLHVDPSNDLMKAISIIMGVVQMKRLRNIPRSRIDHHSHFAQQQTHLIDSFHDLLLNASKDSRNGSTHDAFFSFEEESRQPRLRGGRNIWRPNEDLQAGDLIDCMDKEKCWFESMVQEIHSDGSVKVHFLGWSSKWDDMVTGEEMSIRIAPLNTRTSNWRSQLFEGGLIEIKCNDDMVNQKWMWGKVTSLNVHQSWVEVSYSFSNYPPVVKKAWLYGETICPVGMHTKDKSKVAAAQIVHPAGAGMLLDKMDDAILEKNEAAFLEVIDHCEVLVPSGKSDASMLSGAEVEFNSYLKFATIGVIDESVAFFRCLFESVMREVLDTLTDSIVMVGSVSRSHETRQEKEKESTSLKNKALESVRLLIHTLCQSQQKQLLAHYLVKPLIFQAGMKAKIAQAIFMEQLRHKRFDLSNNSWEILIYFEKFLDIKRQYGQLLFQLLHVGLSDYTLQQMLFNLKQTVDFCGVSQIADELLSYFETNPNEGQRLLLPFFEIERHTEDCSNLRKVLAQIFAGVSDDLKVRFQAVTELGMRGWMRNRLHGIFDSEVAHEIGLSNHLTKRKSTHCIGDQSIFMLHRLKKREEGCFRVIQDVLELIETARLVCRSDLYHNEKCILSAEKSVGTEMSSLSLDRIQILATALAVSLNALLDIQSADAGAVDLSRTDCFNGDSRFRDSIQISEKHDLLESMALISKLVVNHDFKTLFERIYMRLFSVRLVRCTPSSREYLTKELRVLNALSIMKGAYEMIQEVKQSSHYSLGFQKFLLNNLDGESLDTHSISALKSMGLGIRKPNSFSVKVLSSGIWLHWKKISSPLSPFFIPYCGLRLPHSMRTIVAEFKKYFEEQSLTHSETVSEVALAQPNFVPVLRTKNKIPSASSEKSEQTATSHPMSKTLELCYGLGEVTLTMQFDNGTTYEIVATEPQAAVLVLFDSRHCPTECKEMRMCAVDLCLQTGLCLEELRSVVISLTNPASPILRTGNLTSNQDIQVDTELSLNWMWINGLLSKANPSDCPTNHLFERTITLFNPLKFARVEDIRTIEDWRKEKLDGCITNILKGTLVNESGDVPVSVDEISKVGLLSSALLQKVFDALQSKTSKYSMPILSEYEILSRCDTLATRGIITKKILATYLVAFFYLPSYDPNLKKYEKSADDGIEVAVDLAYPSMDKGLNDAIRNILNEAAVEKASSGDGDQLKFDGDCTYSLAFCQQTDEEKSSNVKTNDQCREFTKKGANLGCYSNTKILKKRLLELMVGWAINFKGSMLVYASADHRTDDRLQALNFKSEVIVYSATPYNNHKGNRYDVSCQLISECSVQMLDKVLTQLNSLHQAFFHYAFFNRNCEFTFQRLPLESLTAGRQFNSVVFQNVFVTLHPTALCKLLKAFKWFLATFSSFEMKPVSRCLDEVWWIDHCLLLLNSSIQLENGPESIQIQAIEWLRQYPIALGDIKSFLEKSSDDSALLSRSFLIFVCECRVDPIHSTDSGENSIDFLLFAKLILNYDCDRQSPQHHPDEQSLPSSKSGKDGSDRFMRSTSCEKNEFTSSLESKEYSERKGFGTEWKESQKMEPLLGHNQVQRPDSKFNDRSKSPKHQVEAGRESPTAPTEDHSMVMEIGLYQQYLLATVNNSKALVWDEADCRCGLLQDEDVLSNQNKIESCATRILNSILFHSLNSHNNPENYPSDLLLENYFPLMRDYNFLIENNLRQTYPPASKILETNCLEILIICCFEILLIDGDGQMLRNYLGVPIKSSTTKFCHLSKTVGIGSEVMEFDIHTGGSWFDAEVSSPICTFCDPQVIRSQTFSSILHHTSLMMEIPWADSWQLLDHFDWNVAKVVNFNLNDSQWHRDEVLRKKSNLNFFCSLKKLIEVGSKSPDPEAVKVICKKCRAERETSEMFSLHSCRHWFCKQCWNEYLCSSTGSGGVNCFNCLQSESDLNGSCPNRFHIASAVGFIERATLLQFFIRSRSKFGEANCGSITTGCKEYNRSPLLGRNPSNEALLVHALRDSKCISKSTSDSTLPPPNDENSLTNTEPFVNNIDLQLLFPLSLFDHILEILISTQKNSMELSEFCFINDLRTLCSILWKHIHNPSEGICSKIYHTTNPCCIVRESIYSEHWIFVMSKFFAWISGHSSTVGDEEGGEKKYCEQIAIIDVIRSNQSKMKESNDLILPIVSKKLQASIRQKIFAMYYFLEKRNERIATSTTTPLDRSVHHF